MTEAIAPHDRAPGLWRWWFEHTPPNTRFLLAAAATIASTAALSQTPSRTSGVLHIALLSVFAVSSLKLLLLLLISLKPRSRVLRDLPDGQLPRYSIIVPLFREVRMLPGLMRALEALDYPRDAYEVVLALEIDDAPMRRAAEAELLRSPLRLKIALSPPGPPRTKPKACNAALAQADGDLITVYDAEDRPHPGQLREAAARFAQGSPRLGCLQAPLRIIQAKTWMQRQFALEYASLFEIQLPAYARLGLPFPLGGTSNHLRREALEAAGGWDPRNVTEDADLGMRLAALGWRLDVLALPTLENAPDSLHVWTGQRSRWIKGHMQTWAVHTRSSWRGGWRRAAALQLTLGLSIASSLLHASLASLTLLCVLAAGVDLHMPWLGSSDLWLLFGGYAAAVVTMSQGMQRRRRRMHPADMLTAPFYWPLQTVAAMLALYELVACPHYWRKTPHEPLSDDGSADGA